MNNYLVFFINVMERLALVCLAISSICMIEEIFKYLFQPENTSYAFFFHLYGFIISNLILLVMPQVKQYFSTLEDNDEKQ